MLELFTSIFSTLRSLVKVFSASARHVQSRSARCRRELVRGLHDLQPYHSLTCSLHSLKGTYGIPDTMRSFFSDLCCPVKVFW